jgi:hypothetical protein
MTPGFSRGLAIVDVRKIIEMTSAEPMTRDPVQIRSVADIPDAIAHGMENGGLLLSESNLSPEFFILRSGLAGEVMQKFVNYGIPLAIIVASPEDHGERFCELVREHRNHPTVRFFASETEGREWLAARF